MTDQPQLVRLMKGIYIDSEVENLVFINIGEYAEDTLTDIDEPLKIETYRILKEAYEAKGFEVILLNESGEVPNDTN